MSVLVSDVPFLRGVGAGGVCMTFFSEVLVPLRNCLSFCNCEHTHIWKITMLVEFRKNKIVKVLLTPFNFSTTYAY